MDDAEIVHRISKLADEEHQLERSHAGDGLSEAELKRLHDVEVSLDETKARHMHPHVEVLHSHMEPIVLRVAR